MQSADEQPRDARKIIVRNSIAVSIATWAAKIVNFAYTIFVVRFLGEAGLGQYSTVIAFVGIFGILFEFGTTQLAERNIARDNSRTPQTFWNLVALRLILAVLGMVLITTLALVVGYELILVQGVMIFTMTYILAAFQYPLGSVLKGHEKLHIVSLLQIANQIISSVFGIIFLLSNAVYLSLIYAGFVAMPLQIALSLWFIHRERIRLWPIMLAPRHWFTIVRESLPFGLSSVALTLSFNADTVIIGFFHPVEMVGWYNAAYRLVATVVSLASGFLIALTPSFSREYVSDPKRVHRWAQLGIGGMAFFSVPAAVGLSLLATPVVTLLYGSSFGPSALVLALIAWDIPLRLFNAFGGNVTSAAGLERRAAQIYGLTSALNIVLNLIFIPSYGIIAAAATTIATDALSSLLFFWLLNKHMQVAHVLPTLLRVVVAAAGMGVVVWLFHALPVLLVVLLGGVAYLLLALMLRLVTVPMLVSSAQMFLARQVRAS